MSHFHGLPVELMIEIFVGLDYEELMVIRQCRDEQLCKISRERPVWEYLVKKYIVEHPWLPGPDRPLNTYSSIALEEWLTGRKRVERAWGSATPRVRKILRAELSQIFLIPGGRWLITIPSRTERMILAYDLDASEARSKPLTLELDDFDISRAAMFLNKSSPALQFDVALSMWCRAGSPSLSKLRVWRVALSSHEQDATLEAEDLGSYSIPSKPRMLSLHGDYVAQMTDDRIHVLNWAKSSPTHIVIGVLFPEMPKWLSLLPGARVLSFSLSGIMTVYDIPSLTIRHVTGLNSTIPAQVVQTPHIWMAECHGHCSKMSSGFINSDGDMNFIIYTSNGMKAIIIPASPTQSLRLLDLGRLHGDFQIRKLLLGVHNSVGYSHSSHFVLAHKWVNAQGRPEINGEPGSQTVSIRNRHNLGVPIGDVQCSSLDEASGRVVFATHWAGRTFLVIDFID